MDDAGTPNVDATLIVDTDLDLKLADLTIDGDRMVVDWSRTDPQARGVINVNNNCSTGSSALMLAKQMIEGGIVECALAVGFEQMQKGALAAAWNDRPNPLGLHVNVMNESQGFASAAPSAPR